MSGFFQSVGKMRVLKLATAFAVASLALSVLVWELLPKIFIFDETELLRHVPATIFCDCHGNAVHTESGYDYEIRFPVDLETLPPHLIAVTLAAEDRNFFEHDGVDLWATARAGRQLLTNGRIVSGASTVTMQLVALSEVRRERSFLRKFAQMGFARNLESRWSKEKILEEYFNRLPYGGKIYGIEAAANYYFGRSAKDLNIAESILLAGIPQRPNRFRPDRFPEASKARMNRVLEMLVRQEFFSEDEAEKIKSEPLRLRDFSIPFLPKAENPQFFHWVRARHPEFRGLCKTTLNPEVQECAETAVREALTEMQTIRDGAVLIVENKTRKVRGFLGTPDFKNPNAGQVNAVTARRSPGSLLKPFIFGEAVNGGLITAETLVDDSPLQYRDYRPGNFSGDFVGRVTAQEALAESLNTSAVRLLEALGVSRVLSVLGKYGIDFLPEKNARNVGLSLALGGAETRLSSLAEAYVALANGGVPGALCCIEGLPSAEKRSSVWHAGTAQMVLKMLRQKPLFGAEHLEVAWKTGTSNGLRDAWCIAVTPEWTVAVWFGNKDGSSSPELVGAEAAAPVAGRILSGLYRGCVPAEWRDNDFSRTQKLCKRSGLATGSFCRETFSGTAITGIPLRQCRACKDAEFQNQFSQATRILSPGHGAYLAGVNGVARFVLKSEPSRVHWYLNGKYLGLKDAGSVLELAPGNYVLSAWGGENFVSAEIPIEVKSAGNL